jgi:hypothetical protein
VLFRALKRKKMINYYSTGALTPVENSASIRIKAKKQGEKKQG